jgi:cobaltochelatase CobT
LGNYRLFQRPVSGGQRAFAFTLLVDESASMKGQDKYRIAMKTAILLGETLDQLGVPLEIIGYTTASFEARAAMQHGLTPAHEYRTLRCSPLEHRIYKRFDEPNHVVRARLSGIQPRHNNWDEEHLLFAFRRIQARSERRKAIIVISDGQPNGDANHLMTTVRMLENLGCSVIGIGLGGDFVRQIYRDAIVVSDFRQMANELLQVLFREFRGGVMPLEASVA